MCVGVLGWCVIQQRHETERLLNDVNALAARLAGIESQLQHVSTLWQQERDASGQKAAPVREETLVEPKPGTGASPIPATPEKAHERLMPTHDEKGAHIGAQQKEYRVNARISAIEKFVQLTPEQRERLKAKFAAEIDAEQESAVDPESGDDTHEPAAEGESPPVAAEPVPPETESLEAILGDESAKYYRDQMKQAFDRAAQEEQEKNVLLLSRKLSLTTEQEGQIRDIVRGVETQVSEEMKADQRAAKKGGSSMQKRMQTMLAENALRKKLLDERMKTVLTAEQYQMYLQQQAESANADLEVWHSPE